MTPDSVWGDKTHRQVIEISRLHWHLSEERYDAKTALHVFCLTPRVLRAGPLVTSPESAPLLAFLLLWGPLFSTNQQKGFLSLGS